MILIAWQHVVSARCSKRIHFSTVWGQTGSWAYSFEAGEPILPCHTTAQMAFIGKTPLSLPKTLYINTNVFPMPPHTVPCEEIISLNPRAEKTNHFPFIAFYLKHLISNSVFSIASRVDCKIVPTTSSNCKDIAWRLNTAWFGLMNSSYIQVPNIYQH